MRNGILILIMATMASSAFAQDYRSHMNKGQEKYEDKDYSAAAEQFHNAEVLKPEDPNAKFNYGAALYKSDDFAKAAEQFAKAAGASEEQFKSSSYYDLGNSLYKAQNYAGALEAYKAAMISDPSMMDAKHNFELAKIRLEEQQQQQQQDQNSDENQENQDQQQQNQQQDQQQQNNNRIKSNSSRSSLNPKKAKCLRKRQRSF